MDLHQIQGHKRRSDTEELSEIYSASERKKGSRAPWTSQDMMSAMLLVKQGMSITKAAQSLNIPRTTLRDRVTGMLILALLTSCNMSRIQIFVLYVAEYRNILQSLQTCKMSRISSNFIMPGLFLHSHRWRNFPSI